MSRLRSIVERSYEAFNARDFDAYRELLDEHVEFVAAGITLRGRAAVTDFMAVSARARPGLRIELQRVFAETDDRLVAESRRIDTAPAASAEGAGVVESAASALYRVADGRIVEMHVYVDQAAEDPPAVRMAVAAEQAALLRVAELVARQAPSEEVFALVTEELSHVLDVNVFGTVRFEPDGSMTLLAGSGEYALSPGTNLPLPSGTVVEQVFRTGRPVRLEGYSEVAGPIGDALRQEGARSGAGGPIVVDGALWGAMAVGSTARTLPPGTEDRVAQFAELVSTAISNLESRAKVERLAAEQSALRRVAEVVARQAPPEQVFAVVTDELSELLGVDMVRTVRFEPDGSATVVAARGMAEDPIPPGTNAAIPSGTVIDKVSRTSRPARVDDYAEVVGPIGARLREEGAGSAVGGPIVVDGRLWGAMVACKTAEALPPATEERVAQFAELVSTAISNIESRAKVERLAAEQSALRRVAEVVARHAPPEQVFALVVEELGRLLQVDMVWAVRFEPDGTATIVAGLGTEDQIPVGTNLARPPGTVIDQVFRTGAPTRVERYGRVRGAIGDVLRAEGARCGAGGPIYVDERLWGAVAVASRLETLPSGTEERVAQFTELTSTAISNLESRAKVERLAAEQAALRRVAELVARQAPPEQVFDLVTEELRSLLGVSMVSTVRFEPDGTATVMATRGAAEDRYPPGTNIRLEGGSTIDQVFRTGRPAHVEDYEQIGGQIGPGLRQLGARAGTAGPIVVGGRLWGAMAVASTTAEALPAATEERVAQFAELVSTAISNVESRAQVEQLAAEQSALRRVATLVAREHSPEQLFATLAEELGTLLGVDAASILRYESDSTATVVAGWSAGAIRLPLGERLPLEGANLAGEVLRTGRPQRKEDYSEAAGPIAATVRELGIHAAVASPIVVEGATWGVIAVLSREQEPLAPDIETRLAEFSRHASMAVANAKSRSDLAESRARIVRAGDEARRRLERDLHDGAQQRLVSLGFELGAAEATVPPELRGVRRVLSSLRSSVSDVVDELRELSRGLHPAALSEGGLSSALRSLARRSAVPVDLRLDFGAERFEEPVEVAAYYVASEALTNTVKHAHASRAEVRVRRRDGWLELIVSDDGKGGADASRGSGLTGLVDRVEATGGTIRIDSPPNRGTAVRAKLPTRGDRVTKEVASAERQSSVPSR